MVAKSSVPTNGSHFFPSVSAGWMITEEPLLKPINVKYVEGRSCIMGTYW